MRTSRPVVPLADGRTLREAVTKEGTGVRATIVVVSLRVGGTLAEPFADVLWTPG